MNADSKGLKARQMTARGAAPGWRFTYSPSPERARQVWLIVPPEPLGEAVQAAIQSAQAAGYSDWLAADEAAADYIATRIAPKFGVSVCSQSNCAEGATEISPAVARNELPWVNVPNNNSPSPPRTRRGLG